MAPNEQSAAQMPKMANKRLPSIYFILRADCANARTPQHGADVGGAGRAVADSHMGAGGLEMAPVKPKELPGYTLPIRCRGRVLRLTADDAGFTLALVSGEPLEVTWYGEKKCLKDTLVSKAE